MIRKNRLNQRYRTTENELIIEDYTSEKSCSYSIVEDTLKMDCDNTKSYINYMDECKEQLEIKKVITHKRCTRLYGLDEVDIAPEFPRGKKVLEQFQEQYLYYPDNPKSCEVKIPVIITKSGKISINTYMPTYDELILIIDGIRLDEYNELALEMFSYMTDVKWKPAIKNGKPVNVSFDFPVKFEAEDAEKTSRKHKSMKAIEPFIHP